MLWITAALVTPVISPMVLLIPLQTYVRAATVIESDKNTYKSTKELAASTLLESDMERQIDDN